MDIISSQKSLLALARAWYPRERTQLAEICLNVPTNIFHYFDAQLRLISLLIETFAELGKTFGITNIVSV